jgi:hypothetical protein
VAPTGINVRPTHLYRTEPPPDINVRYLYRVGWRRPRRAPTKGHLYPVVAPTGTDAPICTGGKNLDTKIRPGTNARFSSSDSSTHGLAALHRPFNIFPY